MFKKLRARFGRKPQDFGQRLHEVAQSTGSVPTTPPIGPNVQIGQESATPHPFRSAPPVARSSGVSQSRTMYPPSGPAGKRRLKDAIGDALLALFRGFGSKSVTIVDNVTACYQGAIASVVVKGHSTLTMRGVIPQETQELLEDADAIQQETEELADETNFPE